MQIVCRLLYDNMPLLVGSQIISFKISCLRCLRKVFGIFMLKGMVMDRSAIEKIYIMKIFTCEIVTAALDSSAANSLGKYVIA